MADGAKTVVIQHRSSDQADAGGTEPPLPDYGAMQQQQSSGGFMDWVREHKLLVTVVLGGAGLLLLMYFYNKGSDTSGTDTSAADTSGTDPSQTAGLGQSGYGAPDWSPVVGALSGLQQQDQQDTQQILSQLQSTQAATAASQAGPQAAPPTQASSVPSDWQPQPLGSTPGLSSSQEASKQRQQYIDFHVGKNCAKLSGKKKQDCVNHWTQKAGARHPAQGGAFSPGSSMSLRSMHMKEPSWRSTDHQGIHMGMEN